MVLDAGASPRRPKGAGCYQRWHVAAVAARSMQRCWQRSVVVLPSMAGCYQRWPRALQRADGGAATCGLRCYRGASGGATAWLALLPSTAAMLPAVAAGAATSRRRCCHRRAAVLQESKRWCSLGRRSCERKFCFAASGGRRSCERRTAVLQAVTDGAATSCKRRRMCKLAAVPPELQRMNAVAASSRR